MPTANKVLSLTLKLCLLACTLLACNTGQLVTPDQIPQPQPTDGFIAIAADTNGRVALSLCLDADMTNCPSFGPLDAIHPLGVRQVPAGQYCLQRLVFEFLDGGIGFARDIPQEDTRCFDVRPGQIAYPGHLVFRAKQGQSTWVRVDEGWDKRPKFEADLHAAFPHLARWPVEVVRLHNLVEH